MWDSRAGTAIDTMSTSTPPAAAQRVDADSPDHASEPAAEVVDPLVPVTVPPQPRLVHSVLGFRGRAQDLCGHRQQVGAAGLERCGQVVVASLGVSRVSSFVPEVPCSVEGAPSFVPEVPWPTVVAFLCRDPSPPYRVRTGESRSDRFATAGSTPLTVRSARVDGL